MSITDAEGNPRPVETDTDGGEFVMTSRSDGFLRGAQTFVFTYTLDYVTWTYADTGADEFYWDVNGVGWAQPFSSVTARLTVAPDLVGALTGSAACYRGAQDSTEPCEIVRTDAGGAAGGAAVFDAATSDLAAEQTLTIAVGFTADTFVRFDTSYFASPAGWVQAGGLAGVVLGVLYAVAIRRRKLRDGTGRATIVPEYDPPPGLDALESAVLLGRSDRAIPAEVLEQAVGGSIRVVEGKKRLFGGVALQAELVDPARADGDGRMLLDGLFPDSPTPGAVYEFGSSDTRFSKAAQKILTAAREELVTRGLVAHVPTHFRALPFLVTLFFAAVAIVAGFIAIADSVTPWVPVIGMVAAAVAVIVVLGLLAKRVFTSAGVEARDHLEGLKQFMTWAEADRIRMLQSPEGAERVAIDTSDPRLMLKLYERLLPFAIAFGIEKQWVAELATYYDDGAAPVWYFGTSTFNAAAFSAGVASLSSAATSASSSGGSTGGGSAGGGGGGGGGGGV